MITAKLFTNGSSQAVRLPKDFRFTGDEVYAQKIGETVILVPKNKAWETFIEGINGFTEDYFKVLESRHDEETQSEREVL